MDNYKYIKQVEDDIEEYERLIENHCALSDVIHKVSVTSDYLRGIKDNDTIDNMTYNTFKNKIQQLSVTAWKKCICESRK